jgi:glutathione-specific gamma-glutamylcyclotransferase
VEAGFCLARASASDGVRVAPRILLGIEALARLPQQSGLMLALDRGGCCEGMVHRLPDEDHIGQVGRLLRREIGSREGARRVRWVRAKTANGTVQALAFWVGPKGTGYSGKQPLSQVAHTLARACGHIGSGAVYLFHTVAKLEEIGIRDRNLWRLQQLVADEILRLTSQRLR